MNLKGKIPFTANQELISGTVLDFLVSDKGGLY